MIFPINNFSAILMNVMLIAMIVALLIPIYEACQDDDIWQTMLAFASIATKTSIIMLFISVLRDDWSIGVVAIIILSVGNAGLMLLAHLIKQLSEL
jgi:multicomponent Na+:H+ antiporter subunit F